MNTSDRMAKARAARAAGTERKPRKLALMTDKQIERLAGMPSDYRNVTQTAYLGGSRKAALKAKCLDCACYQKQEVRLCTVEACPLWPYRPYQDAPS